eukprot:Protomagalhaensia_wolfi_Nauph_80__232@NODE_112_length_3628_cov_5_066035_g85_i0_p3_GENE_NODE_112_length_3628_cov_5_066035_g85_i0NODE_112_length_3628_cov_5_066035_g85_i0_p3_ORF_typecomplete_len192_score50_92_NODE_112_length_3628_cov_5_066035_g85_i011991774
MPLILDPDLSRAEFTSFCLERLMRRQSASPGSPTTGDTPTQALRVTDETTSYFDVHQAYVTSKATKLTVPETLPSFSIDSFIAAAPASVTLKALDSSCASGWVKRRDALYVGETPTGKQDVVPAKELYKSWGSKFTRIKQAVNAEIPDLQRATESFKKEADDENAISGDKLTRLAMRLRDIKECLASPTTA